MKQPALSQFFYSSESTASLIVGLVVRGEKWTVEIKNIITLYQLSHPTATPATDSLLLWAAAWGVSVSVSDIHFHNSSCKHTHSFDPRLIYLFHGYGEFVNTAYRYIYAPISAFKLYHLNEFIVKFRNELQTFSHSEESKCSVCKCCLLTTVSVCFTTL